jgi:hypothetical protein
MCGIKRAFRWQKRAEWLSWAGHAAWSGERVGVSYNAGHIEVLKCDAKMLAKDIRRLAKRRDELAECNFLEELEGHEPDADGYIAIDPAKFWWSGDGSGSSWELFIKQIAPKIVGTLEAIVTWEGGDSHTGLRIRDGKVTEPDVVMTLADDCPANIP